MECPCNTIASQTAQITGRLLGEIQVLIITNQALYGTGPSYLRKPLAPMISAHPVTSDRMCMLQLLLIKRSQLMGLGNHAFYHSAFSLEEYPPLYMNSPNRA